MSEIKPFRLADESGADYEKRIKAELQRAADEAGLPPDDDDNDEGPEPADETPSP